MNQRFLGRAGLSVSGLCLGAMTFGRETFEEGGGRLLDRFVEAGRNFIDTANVYGRGESERVLGGWLGEQRREDLVIASKVRWKVGDGPSDQGLGRRHIPRQTEGSLKRLNTDDLDQVHGWDPATPLEETPPTRNTLLERGLVRYVHAGDDRPGTRMDAAERGAGASRGRI